MSGRGYTIHNAGTRRIPNYHVLNPNGMAIAVGMTWRVARKIADALNETRAAERSGYMSGFEDLS